MSSSTNSSSSPEDPPTPRPRRRVLRGIVATALVGGLAAGVFTIADVAASGSAAKGSNHPSKSLEAATSKASSKTPVAVPGPGAFWGKGFGFHGGAVSAGGIGVGAPGIGGLVTGKVTAIGSNSITIASTGNGSQVVRTNASTQYYTMLTKGTSKIVSVGEKVAVVFAPSVTAVPPPARPAGAPTAPPGAPTAPSAAPAVAATSTPNTPVASAIVVIEPWAVGTVVSASSSKIVVKDLGGLEQDILVSGSTSYSEAGTSVLASSVTAGEQVFAYGAVASDPTQLQASNVFVVGPTVGGFVTGVSGTTITIGTGRGNETVTTDASTIFRNGKTSSSLSHVKKGDLLSAIGTFTSKDTFAASAVTFVAPPSVSPGGSTGGSTGTGWARPALGLRARALVGASASGAQFGAFSSFQGGAASVIESLIGSALSS